MKILVITDKHETHYFDIATDEQELAAFLTMFEQWDGKFYQYYADLSDAERAEAKPGNRWYPEMIEQYDRARDTTQSLVARGTAARRLMEIRKSQGYEYEDDWSRETVTDALPGVLKRMAKPSKVRAKVA